MGAIATGQSLEVTPGKGDTSDIEISSNESEEAIAGCKE